MLKPPPPPPPPKISILSTPLHCQLKTYKLKANQHRICQVKTEEVSTVNLSYYSGLYTILQSIMPHKRKCVSVIGPHSCQRHMESVPSSRSTLTVWCSPPFKEYYFDMAKGITLHMIAVTKSTHISTYTICVLHF